MRRLTLTLLAAILLMSWRCVLAAASGDNVIAIIAAPGHGKSLKKEDIALIFKRKKVFWTDGMKIQPVNLPPSNNLRLSFSQAVLGATPDEMEKYWSDMYFHGISPPHVLASEEGVLRFIGDTPGAIGYVSYCRAAGRANILMVVAPSGQVLQESALECAE
jgi:ABC-type phosphate transport system substrate-binding protein